MIWVRQAPGLKAASPGRAGPKEFRLRPNLKSVLVPLAVLALGVQPALGTLTRQEPVLAVSPAFAECPDPNPILVATCHPLATRSVSWMGMAALEMYHDPNQPAVVAFRDTPADNPQYALASLRDVGSVWGVAYDHSRQLVYVAAYHKRQLPFGPGGPGAIYRIGLHTAESELFVRVPSPGEDTHQAGSSGPDIGATHGAGRSSLGGIALSPDFSTLFVMNLHDRHIYVYDTATGVERRRIPHGAAGEPWEADARPFAIAVIDGELYHGLVRTPPGLSPAGMYANVYRSGLGGEGMHLVVEVPLDYPRGLPRPLISEDLSWRPWLDSGARVGRVRRLMDPAIHPQPILADLAQTASGDLVLGFRDRYLDMTIRSGLYAPGDTGGERPGLGLGDVLVVPAAGEGWDTQAVRTPLANNRAFGHSGAIGGLATLADGRLVVTAFNPLGGRSPVRSRHGLFEGVIWTDPTTGDHLAGEGLCTSGTRRSAPPTEVEPPPGRHGPAEPLGGFYLLGVGTTGDVAAACPPNYVPPTPTPTVPPTETPVPTATQVTPPTMTADPPPSVSPPRPVFLPVALRDARCQPGLRHADVVLVIDASSSMLELTRSGRTKLSAAAAAGDTLIRLLSLDPEEGATDQVALISFNAVARIHQPLTANLDALQVGLQELESAQFTRIDTGLQAAVQVLNGPERRPANTAVVILLSDGHNNPEPVDNALAVAAQLKASSVRLITVGLGEAVDAPALEAMASSPDDYHFAPDGDDLPALYEGLARLIPCPPDAFWPHAGR